MIGQNALGVSTAQAAAANTSVVTSIETTAQYDQIIAQYQTQINQAVDQINSANQQIATADQQIQQYQSLLTQLQDSGLITIASDGTVTINQANQPGFFQPSGEHHEGGH